MQQTAWLMRCRNEFFESGRFITSEVCDFLVSVIAEVFNLTIHVYQRKTDGKIQVHSFSTENPAKEVHLKFTHNNTAPGGNHYDCVVRTSLAKKRSASRSTEVQALLGKKCEFQKF